MNKTGHDAVGSTAPDDKTFSTLQAKFALLGHTLTASTTAGRTLYTVSRWGQSRVFSHLHDVDAFLRQVGGAHGV